MATVAARTAARPRATPRARAGSGAVSSSSSWSSSITGGDASGILPRWTWPTGCGRCGWAGRRRGGHGAHPGLRGARRRRARAHAEDMQTIWVRPSFSLADHGRGRARDGACRLRRLDVAGAADAASTRRHRGRGIGTALMRWTWAVRGRARRRPGRAAGVLSTTPARSRSCARTATRSAGAPGCSTIAHDDEPAAPVVPGGLRAACLRPGARRTRRPPADRGRLQRVGRPRPGRRSTTSRPRRSSGPASRPRTWSWPCAATRWPASPCSPTTATTCWSTGSPSRGRTAGRALPARCSSTPSGRRTRSAMRTRRALDRLAHGRLGLYEHVGMRSARTYLHLARALP